MKTLLYFFTILLFSVFSSNSQNLKLENIKEISKAEYVFANIFMDSVLEKELGTTLIRIIKQADTKNTPEHYFEGTGEVLFNLFISLTNTGEYSVRELYKISDLNNPEVVQIQEIPETKKIRIQIKYRDQKGEILHDEIEVDQLF